MARRGLLRLSTGLTTIVLFAGLALAHSPRHDHRVHNPALCHELTVKASLLSAQPSDMEVVKKRLPQQASTIVPSQVRRVKIVITRRAYGVKCGHGVKVYQGFRPPKWLEFGIKSGSAVLPLVVVLPPGAKVDPSLPPGKRLVLVINVCDHNDHLGEVSVVLPKGSKVLGPLSLGPGLLAEVASAKGKSALWDFSLRPGGIGCCGELFAWDSGADEYYLMVVE